MDNELKPRKKRQVNLLKVFFQAKNGASHVYYECPVCSECYRVYYKKCLRCNTNLDKPIGMKVVKEERDGT